MFHILDTKEMTLLSVKFLYSLVEAFKVLSVQK